MKRKSLLSDPISRDPFVPIFYSKSSVPVLDSLGFVVSRQEITSYVSPSVLPAVKSSVFSLQSLIESGNISNLSVLNVPSDFTPEETLDVANAFLSSIETDKKDNKKDNNN